MTDFILANAPVAIPDQDLPLRTGRKGFHRSEGLWQVAGYGDGQKAPLFPDGPRLDGGDAGEKRVFFYQHGSILAASSSLKWLSDWMQARGFATVLDPAAAYCMLSYGYMLEDLTPIAGVRKLQAGLTAMTDGSKWIRSVRVDYKAVEYRNRPKQLWIQALEETFRSSVESLGAAPGADEAVRVTLSGGLDSRMVAQAVSRRFRNISLAGTGQKDYLDHSIGRKVARLLAQPYYYHVLDPGSYLTEVSLPVQLNEGLVFFNGAAHMIPLYRIWNGSNTIWSGLLGDALLGTYNSAPVDKPVQPAAGAVSTKLIHKALEHFPGIADRYPNEVLFKLYNRGFNGINNGMWTTEPFGEMVSPFMTKSFMQLCLSVPPELKYGEALYLDWIRARHPRLAALPWEATGKAPLHARATRWHQRLQRLKVAWYLRVQKDDRPISMLPYLHWERVNPRIREVHDALYDRLINQLDGTLGADARRLYESGSLSERALVLTLLEAIDYLKLKV
jgi:asparagine synthase (glutamine-hydrolysing)